MSFAKLGLVTAGMLALAVVMCQLAPPPTVLPATAPRTVAVAALTPSGACTSVYKSELRDNKGTVVKSESREEKVSCNLPAPGDGGSLGTAGRLGFELLRVGVAVFSEL